MQAHCLPAGRGWSWIVQGFRLFRSNPAFLTFMVIGYWLVLMAVNLVPFLGALAAPLCVPALSVSVMNGCRALDRGEQVNFGMLFSGFQDNLRGLLMLGALYTVGSLIVLGVTFWVDGGLLLEMMLTGKAADPDDLRDGHLLAALQVALVLTVPLLMAFWFSPMLTAWNGLTPAKSVFFSFVASWRNWRAFLVYGLGVAFLSAVLPGIVLALAGLFSAWLFRMLAAALTMPLVFVFLPTLFGSFYASYRDVFGTPETREALA
jgi:hypothetical protein